MNWQTRADFLKRKSQSTRPLSDKLDELGYAAGAPARAIVDCVEEQFKQANITELELLRSLMSAFWAYGRKHWTWTSSSTPSAADGGLVKGAVNYAACGTFSADFALLACDVLGIKDLESITKEGRTAISGSFVTMPMRAIDSQWQGNVMTDEHDFANLRMFKFSSHFFCCYKKVIFDPTSNMTYHTAQDMIAFRLTDAPPEVQREYGPRDCYVYQVTDVNPGVIWRPGMRLWRGGDWFLVQVGTERLDAGGASRGFGTYLLTQRSKLISLERWSHSLRTGRTAHTTYDKQ